MMGWLVAIALASAAAAALAWIARVRGAALWLALAAMGIAMMGYAWQGNPDLHSAPALALREPQPLDAKMLRAHPLKTAFTREDMAVNTAEALIRARNSSGAISLLKTELATEPDNAELWIALGQAFVAHGDGLVSPAALLAFDKAAAINPARVEPPMMHALALAQSGRLDESALMITALLAHMPENDPQRPDVARNLAEIRARLAAH